VPEISVLMAVYNGERYLEEAIKSILGQSFGDFEFVIVDDASTDGTSSILKDYALTDKRIRLISNEKNLGLSRSLNHGLEQAKGAYIARMDADDIARPERFATQFSWLKAHPEILVLGSAIQMINENGEQLPSEPPPLTSAQMRWNSFFGRQFVVCHPSVMVRRELFERFGVYAELPTSQDLELWGRLICVEPYPITNLSEVLLDYRVHCDSVSEKRNELQMETSNKVRLDTINRTFDSDYSVEMVNEYRLASSQRKFVRKQSISRYISEWFEVLESFRVLFSYDQEELAPCIEDLLTSALKYVSLNPFSIFSRNRIWLPSFKNTLEPKYYGMLWEAKMGRLRIQP
jgi:glycosyltransferase involved in cell wall biosynthesis